MAGKALAQQISETPAQWRIPSAIPSVLVVDTDRQCIDSCARMLDDLNYPHQAVTTARDALETISQDSAIQILVVNTHMPTFDGFVLIEEARERIGASRPLAAIFTTERVTTELAVRGLHIEAVDLLAKPLRLEEYSSALRRANRYLGARRALAEGGDVSGFGHQISRLVSMLEGKGAEPRSGRPTDKEISATLRAIINARGLRSRYFPSEFFADPAWDILLDLTRAQLEDQQVSVSSVCIAASVPMSTALRWVKQMVEAGLLRRWTDPKDRRRDLIALTDATAQQMRDYLAIVHANFSAL